MSRTLRVVTALLDWVAERSKTRWVGSDWSEIAGWARAGDVERLRREARAALESEDAGGELSVIVHALALTPNPEFADAVRELSRSLNPRWTASLTASGQPDWICAELVAKGEPADEEFLACLAQELVLRRRLADTDPFASFWRTLRERGHPLGRLPLRLTRLETSFGLPSYHLTGASYFGPSAFDDAVPVAGTTMVGTVLHETTTDADRVSLDALVETWGGKVESRVFALDAMQARSLARVLSEARLACLDGEEPSDLVAIGAEGAFLEAFWAASQGGAYGYGEFGAYGRLVAWRTLGALAGAGPDEPIERVAEQVARTDWYSFRSDWFFDIAWDVALVAVPRDGSRLAVLSATDED